MAMLDRLRDAHPDCDITDFDGHYRRIGDADMGIVDHIVVRKDDRRTSCAAVERGRRKRPHDKAIEERFDRFVGRFAAAA